LVWARYAVERYRPEGLAILVVGNDFDESHRRYGEKLGMHVYAKGETGRLELQRVDYEPSLFRKLVRHSALGRYLGFNLHAVETIGQLIGWLGGTSPAVAGTPDYVGNTAATASPERVRDSYAAIAAFLDDLSSSVALPPQRITFMIEGARYPDAVASTEQSYFGLMRARFIEEAGRRGHEVIDLQPWFLARGRDGTRFEFPTDNHWNANGHAVAADALAASRRVRALFPSQQAASALTTFRVHRKSHREPPGPAAPARVAAAN